jgi:hypothetical protein
MFPRYLQRGSAPIRIAIALPARMRNWIQGCNFLRGNAFVFPGDVNLEFLPAAS